MIIVKLMGGLGNQMFQYALGRTLAIKNNQELYLDLSFLLDRTPRKNFVFRDYDLDIFPVKAKILSNEEFKKIKRYIPSNRFSRLPSISKLINLVRKIISNNKIKYVREKSLTFQKGILDLKGSLYLDGYWQSPEYFESVEKEIRKDFKLSPDLDQPTTKLATEIKDNNSVCINVRRGDFINISITTKFHGFHGVEYIHEAVNLITKKINNPHFYIFSDDVEWCEENIKIAYPKTFVGHEFAGKKFSSYLYLMTQCKHFIIPNSTFAWWAAWLNQNPNKIIVTPKKWLAETAIDIVPDSWIKI